MRSDDATTREGDEISTSGCHMASCPLGRATGVICPHDSCDLEDGVRDVARIISTLAAEVERVKGLLMAPDDGTHFVRVSTEMLAELERAASQPVTLRITRRDTGELDMIAERHDCATARADAIEHAAKVCEFRAQSNAEDSHDYLAANEAGKCAVAVRWLITQPERFAARLALLEEGTHE